MSGRTAVAVILMSALGAGGCTSAGVPQLPAGSAGIETSSAARPAPVTGQEPTGTTVMAKGTPTEIYEVVARGALGCWFGANGPLKPSHVFHAEAAPPVEGGAAEINLHERDPSFRDQRGPRAFRVTFAGAPGGAQVGIVNIKMAAALGDAMTKDVEVWVASGQGCELRRLLPPPPPPTPAKSKGKGKTPKGKASDKAARKP
jgi:hypothetical protein